MFSQFIANWAVVIPRNPALQTRSLPIWEIFQSAIRESPSNKMSAVLLKFNGGKTNWFAGKTFAASSSAYLRRTLNASATAKAIVAMSAAEKIQRYFLVRGNFGAAVISRRFTLKNGRSKNLNQIPPTNVDAMA